MGASDGPTPHAWAFEAIGTAWEIVTSDALPLPVRDAVTGTIAAFDRDWSRFRPDSTVSALAARGGHVPAPPDAGPMLDAYAELSEATGGAVNPLVGASLEALGYDATYSLRDRGPRPAPERWRDVLSWQGGSLTLAQPASIDVGAIGKGRLVDRVMAVVAAAMPGDAVVDAGGDIAVRGTQRIGLEHPFDRRRAIGVWEVTDAALCASATNRRAWPPATGAEGLHHVLDARTGMPVRTIAATWAVAEDAMTADAIATALFFDGGPALAFHRRVEWVRMTTDGRVEWSPGCRAELFVRPDTVGS